VIDDALWFLAAFVTTHPGLLGGWEALEPLNVFDRPNGRNRPQPVIAAEGDRTHTSGVRYPSPKKDDMQVAFLLYDGFTAVDMVGPYEVLKHVPGAAPLFVAEEQGPVRDESDTLALVADASLQEVTTPEIIVVPGGFGTGLLLEHEPLLSWLSAAHETSTWTTSVCMGSLLLAAVGLLDGAPAATHWMARERLASLGALPIAERVVHHGKIITAAGVSAGIDMALRLAQLIQGDAVAQAIQLGIEYDPDPPFDAGSPDKAPQPLVEVVARGFSEQERAFKERALA